MSPLPTHLFEICVNHIFTLVRCVGFVLPGRFRRTASLGWVVRIYPFPDLLRRCRQRADTSLYFFPVYPLQCIFNFADQLKF